MNESQEKKCWIISKASRSKFDILYYMPIRVFLSQESAKQWMNEQINNDENKNHFGYRMANYPQYTIDESVFSG